MPSRLNIQNTRSIDHTGHNTIHIVKDRSNPLMRTKSMGLFKVDSFIDRASNSGCFDYLRFVSLGDVEALESKQEALRYNRIPWCKRGSIRTLMQYPRDNPQDHKSGDCNKLLRKKECSFLGRAVCEDDKDNFVSTLHPFSKWKQLPESWISATLYYQPVS